MKRALLPLLATVLLAALAPPALAVIYEVADKDGNVTHYKYTDRKGSVVFTDNLAGIPEGVRKSNKVVRIGPPPKPKPPEGGQPPADQPSEAASGPIPSLRDVLVTPAPPPPPPPEESGGFPWGMAVLAAALLGGAAVAFRAVGSRRGRAAPRVEAPVYQGRERAQPPRDVPAPRPDQPLEVASAAVPPRRDERAAEGVAQPSGESSRREETPRDAIERLLRTGDYAGAAQLCDAQGETARGAELYLKAGLFAEAAASFEQLGDFARAGDNQLRAGDPEKAAASFAKAEDPVRGCSAMAAYHADHGDLRQAAAWAEKAGDLVQAATHCQEVGDLARAADLYARAGFHAEAAEIFTLLNDLPHAAEAFEKAGRPTAAAAALERCGGEARRIAELYEQGGRHYPAGRLYIKLGDLDRALASLQRVDAAAAEHPQASLLVGMIFLKRGLTNLAQEKFAALVGGRPIQRATLEPYYFLALCHERSGEPEKARAIFEKILAEDYNFRDVKNRLAQR